HVVARFGASIAQADAPEMGYSSAPPHGPARGHGSVSVAYALVDLQLVVMWCAAARGRLIRVCAGAGRASEGCRSARARASGVRPRAGLRDAACTPRAQAVARGRRGGGFPRSRHALVLAQKI